MFEGIKVVLIGVFELKFIVLVMDLWILFFRNIVVLLFVFIVNMVFVFRKLINEDNMIGWILVFSLLFIFVFLIFV